MIDTLFAQGVSFAALTKAVFKQNEFKISVITICSCGWLPHCLNPCNLRSPSPLPPLYLCANMKLFHYRSTRAIPHHPRANFTGTTVIKLTRQALACAPEFDLLSVSDSEVLLKGLFLSVYDQCVLFNWGFLWNNAY